MAIPTDVYQPGRVYGTEVSLLSPDDGRDRDDPLYWQIRREFEETMRRRHWWWVHFCRGTLRGQRQLEAQRLSRSAEQQTARLIEAMGYQVQPTTHKAPFDLWVGDGQRRGVRVEVKISLYHTGRKGGRYQADVRHCNQADLLIFLARCPTAGGYQDWPFVTPPSTLCAPVATRCWVPMADIAPRRHVAIWSLRPAAYSGRWAPYLGAWQHLHQAVAAARPARAWQPALFKSAGAPASEAGEE